MKILAIRPTPGPSAVARFDVEVGPYLRLCNMTLRKAPDGRFRSYPPNAHGKAVATIHPNLASEITQAAKAAFYRGSAANGQK
jgi:hypothetical protein